MPTPSPSPQWPLYEQRCRDWTTALKQVHGDFRRDKAGETFVRFMVLMLVAIGIWMLWTTTSRSGALHSPEWTWARRGAAAIFLGLAAMLVRRSPSVCYRFESGEISEIARGGRVRWREPLATLQSVDLRWTVVRRGLPVLILHWPTHRRTIELFPSLANAVTAMLRPERLSSLSERPEKSWRCADCNEQNPEGFEKCWHCGSVAVGHE